MKLYSPACPLVCSLALPLLLAAWCSAQAAGLDPARISEQQKTAKFDDSILQAMDHGPFLAGMVHGQDLALKGIAIKLAGGRAGMSFDTLTLRMADGWTGGYLRLTGERTTGGKPHAVGEPVFWTHPGPGWAWRGKFDGPRPEYTTQVRLEPKKPKAPKNQKAAQNSAPRNSAPTPQATPEEPEEMVKLYTGIARGPLPREWARFKGLYRHGDQVVLSYSVGATEILELPGYQEREGLPLLTRTLHVGKSREALTALVCEDAEAVASIEDGIGILTRDNVVTAVGLVNAPAGAALTVGPKSRLLLKLPPLSRPATVQIVIARLPGTDTAAFRRALAGSPALPEVAALTKGGPRLWGEPLKTPGRPGLSTGAYVVDTFPLPENNPFKSWIRCSGLDFFSDGTRAAVCSLSGDVWLVSNIDAKLDKVTWQRFATGLFQPLGLRIVKDTVYVLGRDQITRLHDLNKDGEADFYENFNNDVAISDHYHEFCLNLETDSKGYFYFIKGGNLGDARHAHHGTMLRVSPDGRKLEVFATGFRAPNGLGMGPQNQISAADNEGNWVPTSRVSLVRQGGFYGHVFTAHRETPPTDYGQALLWLPHQVDNSSGGQVWVTSRKWGPFYGDMLHLSYGSARMFKVMQDPVGSVVNGAVVEFPLRFESGIMRGRFNQKDGQLYVCGLRVWQSAGAKDGAFHRVRYTGKPVTMPREFRVKPNGLEITFTGPLDAKEAADPENYAIDQWNYRWTREYGSKWYSVSDPDKVVGEKSQATAKGDDVPIKSAKVSSDGRTVFLEVPGLQPVMSLRVRYNLLTAEGRDLDNSEIYATINAVPKAGK
jgi:hypothetical protein